MELSLNELKVEWKQHFRKSPPANARSEFLRNHLKWHQQAKQLGGLSRKAKSQLKQLTQQLRDGIELAPSNALTLKPGTKLLREYKGCNYEVIVCGDGYQYDGQMYNSLSKIAREITGTRWNGKLFFGVKK